MQFAVLDPGQAEEHGRSAVRRLPRQLFAGGAAGLLEGGLQHQILRRIAGEVELRRQHEVGAESGGLGARLSDAIAIARDVADDRRDLRERDDEAIGGRGHAGETQRKGLCPNFVDYNGKKLWSEYNNSLALADSDSIVLTGLIRGG